MIMPPLSRLRGRQGHKFSLKTLLYIGLVKTNTVLGVFSKIRLKLVCSATETSWTIEILLVPSLDTILYIERII